jgi:hypothetical protein
MACFTEVESDRHARITRTKWGSITIGFCNLFQPRREIRIDNGVVADSGFPTELRGLAAAVISVFRGAGVAPTLSLSTANSNTSLDTMRRALRRDDFPLSSSNCISIDGCRLQELPSPSNLLALLWNGLADMDAAGDGVSDKAPGTRPGLNNQGTNYGNTDRKFSDWISTRLE